MAVYEYRLSFQCHNTDVSLWVQNFSTAISIAPRHGQMCIRQVPFTTHPDPILS
jgi:hypothetical protein